MGGTALIGGIERAKLERIAESLVIATAVALPWSTSAVSILLVVWLLVLIPTLDWPGLRRELLTPAGGLPVALVALGALGMLWAEVSLYERWKGFDSFLKLLAIPLLFVQFRRSERGQWVLAGYVLSCVILLLCSYLLVIWPEFPLHLSRDWAVPVRNAASQSGAFVTCIFGLAYLAYEAVTRRQWTWAAALVAVMLAMLANILFVATGRTALVLIVVLLALFACKKMTLRGVMAVFLAAAVVATTGWFGSPYFHKQVSKVWVDLRSYQTSDERNSSGERIEFYKKSIEFIADAPVIGHGTGSIRDLFVKASSGTHTSSGARTVNPHNQTFAVAIQLGLVGAIVLWAMWIAHLLLLRGTGLAEWVGLLIVVQNVVGSLLNSHLFDFMQGWVYVLGVGVAGGMVLKRRAAEKPSAP